MKGSGSWQWHGVGQGYVEAMPGDHSPGRWLCVTCCGRGVLLCDRCLLSSVPVVRLLACIALLAVYIKFPSKILGVSRAKAPYQKLTVLFEMNSLPCRKGKQCNYFTSNYLLVAIIYKNLLEIHFHVDKF